MGPKKNIRFLNIQEVLSTLSPDTCETPSDFVPPGVKKDCYYIVNNSDNINRRDGGQKKASSGMTVVPGLRAIPSKHCL